MWEWVIPAVILTITGIEVSANQVDSAESGYIFVIGRARPLVNIHKARYYLAPYNGQMIKREGWRTLQQDYIYVYMYMSDSRQVSQ